VGSSPTRGTSLQLSEKSLSFLRAAANAVVENINKIQNHCYGESLQQNSNPSSLRPSKLLFFRAPLAKGQPAWESGMAQRILAEKMGE
jgi:hypothetical protein